MAGKPHAAAEDLHREHGGVSGHQGPDGRVDQRPRHHHHERDRLRSQVEQHEPPLMEAAAQSEIRCREEPRDQGVEADHGHECKQLRLAVEARGRPGDGERDQQQQRAS